MTHLQSAVLYILKYFIIDPQNQGVLKPENHGEIGLYADKQMHLLSENTLLTKNPEHLTICCVYVDHVKGCHYLKMDGSLNEIRSKFVGSIFANIKQRQIRNRDCISCSF